MTPDATATVDAQDAEVMASVDTAPRTSEYVIADISQDEAWLTTPLSDAVTLSEWQ